MAETGCVFDVQVPAGPARTPEQVMHPEPGSGKNAPRAVNRWYTIDITAGRDVTIGKVFDEAERRDPEHARTWIALVRRQRPPDNLRIKAEAKQKHNITVEIIIDFVHVLEYLWKAAWSFQPAKATPPPGDLGPQTCPGHPGRSPDPRRRCSATSRHLPPTSTPAGRENADKYARPT